MYKTNTARKIAQTEIDNAQIQSLTRVPEVIMSLKSGKVNGMVIEGPVAEAYLKQNKDLTLLMMLNLMKVERNGNCFT